MIMDYKQALTRVNALSQNLLKYFLSKRDLTKITKIAFLSTVLYFIGKKCFFAFFGPLSHIPGPFYTRFIKKPLVLTEIPKGTGHQKAKNLHEKYGEVVRFGPNTVSVSSLKLAEQVLSIDDLQKGPIYSAVRADRQPNLFTARDKDWHKSRRRIVSTAFSLKYLKSLEPYMTSCVKTFVQQIDKEIDLTKDNDGYGTVDLWNLLQRLAIDVIGETAFGQSFHTVENKNHFIPDAVGEVMRTISIQAILPPFFKFFIFNHNNPHWTVTKFLLDVIHERHSDKSKERKDILQCLIDSEKAKDQNDRLKPEEIVEETLLFLIAGSETTSNTIGFSFFELLKYPDKLAKLYQEIDGIYFNEDGELHYEELKHLPYLNAVINETLRLDPVAAGSFDRCTTKPTVLGDMLLPERTNVYVNTYHLQTNEKHWPNPYEFIPERWTGGQSGLSNDLDAHLPFSIGSRSCIGRNFAYQETKLTIATLLKNFDIKPIPSEMKDGEIRRQYITLRMAKNSFKCKIRRRS